MVQAGSLHQVSFSACTLWTCRRYQRQLVSSIKYYIPADGEAAPRPSLPQPSGWCVEVGAALRGCVFPDHQHSPECLRTHLSRVLSVNLLPREENRMPKLWQHSSCYCSGFCPPTAPYTGPGLLACLPRFPSCS